MATTIDEIALFLEKNEIRHTVKEALNVIVTYFETEEYFNADEEHRIQILIMLEKKGNSIQFVAPHCYNASNTINKAALFEVLLGINWENRIVQYRHDVKDGEIRVGFSYPIEDAKPTEHQILTSMFVLVSTLNQHHNLIQSAIESRPIQFPEHEKERVNFILDSLFVEQHLNSNPPPPILPNPPPSEDSESSDDDVWL